MECLYCLKRIIRRVKFAGYCTKQCRRRQRLIEETGIDRETLEKCLDSGMSVRSHTRSRKYWLAKTWNGYTIVPEQALPLAWGPRINLRVKLRHTNGHEKEVNLRSLYYTAGPAPTPKSQLLEKKYGKLTVLDVDLPDYVFQESHTQKIKLRCDCGNEVTKYLKYVTNGDTKSCGDCNKKPIEEWFALKYHRLSIVPLVDSPHNRGLKLPRAFSPGHGKGKKIEVECECGKKNTTNMYDLLTYRTLSCGCALNESHSSASREFYEYIKTLVPSAQYSVKGILPHREIDVFLPEQKIAIEYHGNIWHSSARRGPHEVLKDHEKYLMLSGLGIRSIQVYSDEWEFKRKVFESYFMSIFAKNQQKRRKVLIKFVDHPTANAFLQDHHYLGAQKGATLCLAAYSGAEILGVWTFKKRNGREIEITRIAWHHGYKAWNPHQLALDFVRTSLIEAGYEEIITFSENRLHEGILYAKLGFVLDKELRPDYMYTNGVTRVHKFQFRVPAGIKEEDEARKKGYYRIYDCGKKRWKLCLKRDN